MSIFKQGDIMRYVCNGCGKLVNERKVIINSRLDTRSNVGNNSSIITFWDKKCLKKAKNYINK